MLSNMQVHSRAKKSEILPFKVKMMEELLSGFQPIWDNIFALGPSYSIVVDNTLPNKLGHKFLVAANFVENEVITSNPRIPKDNKI
jgi:hypothetical protein